MTSAFNKLRAAAFGVVVLAVAGANATTAAAADHRVLVINSTNHTMTNLYASRISDSNFHGDWLGRWALAPGARMVINFRDGTGACRFDVLARFSDGDRVTRRDFNVCAESRMNFVGN
jgi:hypothetical protein